MFSATACLTSFLALKNINRTFHKKISLIALLFHTAHSITCCGLHRDYTETLEGYTGLHRDVRVLGIGSEQHEVMFDLFT